MSPLWTKLIPYFSGGRKITTGAAIFALAGIIIYIFYPQQITQLFGSWYWFVGGCAVLGGVAQESVAGITRLLLPKSSAEIEYFENLQQLRRDYQRGLITKATYERIVDKLTDQRYLGNQTNRQLPP